MGAVLYRFTRDLRLDDHAGLAAAASHGEVVPLLVRSIQTWTRVCRPRHAGQHSTAARWRASILRFENADRV